MRRINIASGDCFELKLQENLYTYFQYISEDLPFLGSDCIRFFNKMSNTEITTEDDFKEIYNSGTWFYSHTYIKVAVRKNLYKKVGNFSLPLEELDSVLFRSDEDLNFPLRIRKIGQSIEDSVVDIATYQKLKPISYEDAVMGPPAFQERILHKLKNKDYEHLY